MKHILALFALILSVTVVFAEDCGTDAVFESAHNSCTFRCTEDGVIFDCSKKSCRCNKFGDYFNTDTKKCSEVNCDNMDCAGKPNEAFFGTCQSGSRDGCGCENFVTMDCRRGCMCKNGFCRKDGEKCQPRGCVHPFFN